MQHTAVVLILCLRERGGRREGKREREKDARGREKKRCKRESEKKKDVSEKDVRGRVIRMEEGGRKGKRQHDPRKTPQP